MDISDACKICEKYDTSNEHCYHSECHAKDKAIIVMLDKILHNFE
jgi:hypothetical protein